MSCFRILLIPLMMLGAGFLALAQEATEPEDEAGDELVAHIIRPWTGDFEAMVERRFIRALVVYNRTYYFLDGADQKGLTYEAMQEFEEVVNQQLETGHQRVQLVFVPVRRDDLLPALIEGRGDIAAANLTITEERLEEVDFAHPFAEGVSELLVTGPGVPVPDSLDGLSGYTVHARPSSSYFSSLQTLNQRLVEEGQPEIDIVEADENLEDEDLLEMVNAGLIPAVVVDSHKAQFWQQVFSDITIHEDIALRTDGKIAWAIRKDSPQLAEVINAFVDEYKQGTMLGNVLLERYLSDADYVVNALAASELEKLRETLAYFQRYGAEYGFDWRMLAAQGYQESRLDQSTRSPAGAIGVMQLLPTTAADPNVGIPDIEGLENNIHAGVKYLHFLRSNYFDDPGIDAVNQTLLVFAAYNLGPGRVAGLREEATAQGLDPNQWFDHVETIAARRVGREPVQYISNIYKYYVVYRQNSEQLEASAKPAAD